jgi:hypothetical protein
MILFPALRPKAYGIDHGDYPASVLQTMSGRTAILQHSTTETGIRFPAQFVGLTQEQVLDVFGHYESVGSVIGFTFDPVTLPATETPAGFRWRYAREPVSVLDLDSEFFSVSCQFIADLYPDFSLDGGWATLFIRGDEQTVSIPRTVAPAAPTITLSGLTAGVTSDGFVEVSGLRVGSSWQFSTNGGSSWSAGASSGFTLPEGTYAAGAVRVRQTDSDGLTSTAAQNAAAITVAPPNSAVVAFTAAAGAITTGTVTLPLVARMVRFSMNHRGWFTLYASVAARSADSSRAATVDPGRGVGVCADPRLPAGEAINLNPFPDIRNEESPATTTYPWKHVNEDTLSRDFVIILTIITP